MVGWIDAVTKPLEAAGKAAQGLIDIRDTVKFGNAVIQLQAQILAAQQGASMAQARETEMTEEIRSLKAHMAELEAWEAEKNRYLLEKLPPGIFVYTLKPAMANGEPPHCICQTCYQRGKKSILHTDELHNGVQNYRCKECDTTLQAGIYQRPNVNRGRPNPDF